jgi:ADP-heptose:LPS heptosyltransferase
MIVISPYSKLLRNGARNPKDYPYWPELVKRLNELGYEVIQIGVKGEAPIEGVKELRLDLKLKYIKQLLLDSHTWISVDNFLPHLASHINKPGIVLWGMSNPAIFGYSENVNLLKHHKYLKADQFGFWEDVVYNPDAFVDPMAVIEFI